MTKHNNNHDEHSLPQKYCRTPQCEHTRLLGDYNRLHLRTDDCPPYGGVP